MAQQAIDPNAQEDLRVAMAKIQANFTELYGSVGTGVASVTSLTTSGAVSSASLTASGAVSSATAVVSGLATEQSLKLDTGTKTATAAAGAATLNKSSGIVTTEALTTAAGSSYTLTLTDSAIAAGDIAVVSVDANGSTGLPVVASVKTTASTLTVIVNNAHASAAFNAALKIAFAILKA